MKCKDALKLIHQALDGEASDEALARLSAHTEQCSECAAVWEDLSGMDSLLRSEDIDTPEDAYFEAMRLQIGARVREREVGRRSALAPSWVFSLGMAAACLVLGLMAGHAAFPRTVTQTKVVEVEKPVPGPVQVVKEEVEVIKEVTVPGPERVVYRDRPVYRERVVYRDREAEAPVLVAVADDPGAGGPMTPTTAAPAMRPARGDSRAVFAALSFGGSRADSGPGLSAEEMRGLAARLAEDAGRADDALATRRLAATLASEVGAAGVEIERAAIDAAADAADTQ